MGGKPKACIDCGGSLPKGNRKRCVKCARKKEKADNARLGRLGKIKREVLIPERGNKCEVCGASGTLHAHHIKPRKDGGTDKPSNLLLVCSSCHKSIHKRAK